MRSQLPDFLHRAAQLDAEFITYDDGYRSRRFTYKQVAQAAEAFRRRLKAAGMKKGDRAVLWSESRMGWVAALWACLLEGVVVVPVDAQSSPALLHRIVEKSKPRLILAGETPPSLPDSGVPVWPVPEIETGAGDATREPALEPQELDTNDVAELVFTSGTTAEPKGVVITHANLLANLEPIHKEIQKYRKLARPFLPLRILNLLPLSHLFGQSLALFIPPMIPVSVVFISATNPQEIARQIHARKISALIAVPRVLEVLRDFVRQRFPEAAADALPHGRWWVQWWRFRRVHRLLGWKFWCFVSGGAPLSPDVEEFWTRLGFLVVQGYGLTETAPIVSLTHPFHVKRGTVGKPLGGVEVRIAEDGEVLVRGGNVTTGYFDAPSETQAAVESGWLHTGDIGKLDANGNLTILGRKKEMIVTPEGLNVFPEDVEAALDRVPGVRDSAVIGKDRVHAVLLLEPGTQPDSVIREANQHLEEHQKIRDFSVWPGTELPRTEGTHKLKRAEIVAQLRSGAVGKSASNGKLAQLLRKYAPGRTITSDTTLDELGLSSLDRADLMMSLERSLESPIDESAFASMQKVGDLAKPLPSAEPIPFPAYNRAWPARVLRRLALPVVLLPLTRIFAHVRSAGRQNLSAIRGPAIFAANHQSHMDVPAILAALPSRWRYSVQPAMAKDFFDPHFFPRRFGMGERLLNTLLYRLATLFFAAFPIPRQEAGTRQTLRYMGELADGGWSILIFPEGVMTTSGEIAAFRPGVGMMAAHLKIPIIPVRLKGLDHVLHRTAHWPSPGPVEIAFGHPVSADGKSYEEIVRDLESAVRAL